MAFNSDANLMKHRTAQVREIRKRLGVTTAWAERALDAVRGQGSSETTVASAVEWLQHNVPMAS